MNVYNSACFVKNGLKEIHSRNWQASKEDVTIVKVKDVVAQAVALIVGKYRDKWSYLGFHSEVEARGAIERKKS